MRPPNFNKLKTDRDGVGVPSVPTIKCKIFSHSCDANLSKKDVSILSASSSVLILPKAFGSWEPVRQSRKLERKIVFNRTLVPLLSYSIKCNSSKRFNASNSILLASGLHHLVKSLMGMGFSLKIIVII